MAFLRSLNDSFSWVECLASLIESFLMSLADTDDLRLLTDSFLQVVD
jgi:hypothetical protein